MCIQLRNQNNASPVRPNNANKGNAIKNGTAIPLVNRPLISYRYALGVPNNYNVCNSNVLPPTPPLEGVQSVFSFDESGQFGLASSATPGATTVLNSNGYNIINLNAFRFSGVNNDYVTQNYFAYIGDSPTSIVGFTSYQTEGFYGAAYSDKIWLLKSDTYTPAAEPIYPRTFIKNSILLPAATPPENLVYKLIVSDVLTLQKLCFGGNAGTHKTLCKAKAKASFVVDARTYAAEVNSNPCSGVVQLPGSANPADPANFQAYQGLIYTSGGSNSPGGVPFTTSQLINNPPSFVPAYGRVYNFQQYGERYRRLNGANYDYFSSSILVCEVSIQVITNIPYLAVRFQAVFSSSIFNDYPSSADGSITTVPLNSLMTYALNLNVHGSSYNVPLWRSNSTHNFNSNSLLEVPSLEIYNIP